MIHRASDWLTPHQIRAAHFASKRPGLDPEQVSAFLGQVAEELNRLYRDLATAETELARIKQGLRQWQARHADCTFADPQWPIPPNRRRW